MKDINVIFNGKRLVALGGFQIVEEYADGFGRGEARVFSELPFLISLVDAGHARILNSAFDIG